MADQLKENKPSPEPDDDSSTEGEFMALTNVRQFIRDELTRRETDIGLEYDNIGAIKVKKGPDSAWARVCSNAQAYGKTGFIMYGLHAFNDMYGFNQNDQGNVGYLGYDVTGKKHTIETVYYKHRPPPGVTKVAVSLEGGKFRKATINWTCWSLEQLEYLEKFFLNAGVSCFIEWGWSNIYPNSLIDLNGDMGTPEKKDPETGKVTKGTGLLGLYNNFRLVDDRIKASNGNYDMIFGIISKYSFTLRENGGYDCTTEVIQPGRLVSGLSNSGANPEQKDETGKIVKKVTFKEWIKKYLDDDVEREYAAAKPTAGEFGRVYKDDREKNVWLSIGYVMDLVNKFFKATDGKHGIPFGQFDISKSRISAHPNLKSTDGKVLLIPNCGAPSGAIKKSAKGSTFNPSAPYASPDLEEANKALHDASGNFERVNLEQIICKNRKPIPPPKSFMVSPYSFPDYHMKDSNGGYSGLLENLYIHIDVLREASNRNERITQMLDEILGKMSGAAGNIWNFEIRQVGNKASGSPSLLTIIDSQYIGKENVSDILGKNETYVFKTFTDKSVVKSLSFSAQLSDNVANDTMFKSGGSGGRNEDRSSADFFIINKEDRFFGGMARDLPDKQVNKNTAGSDLQDAQRAKSERHITEDSFFPVGRGENIIKLVEPNPELLKSWITDQNPKNTAVYNGVIPGVHLELSTRGIAGLRFFDMFHVLGLPKRYSDSAIWQITDVKDDIEGNMWATTITAMMRPKPNLGPGKPVSF